MTNINDELFNAFLVWATNANSWDDQAASMWTRMGEGREWDVQITPGDPYDLLPICVMTTPKASNLEVMMMMYGWATPINEEGDDTGEERRRVRVLVHFHEGKERVAVQFKGETLEEVPNGEGMFGDRIRELRAIQSTSN